MPAFARHQSEGTVVGQVDCCSPGREAGGLKSAAQASRVKSTQTRRASGRSLFREAFVLQPFRATASM